MKTSHIANGIFALPLIMFPGCGSNSHEDAARTLPDRKRVERALAGQGSNRLEHSPSNEAVDALKDQRMIDFPKEDDRQTIMHLYTALKEQCGKEHNEAVRERQHWATVI